ncbi:hypothetical protein [Dyadobacter sp. 50-39]|uniref:hypothetical protein n=1 Tax=Dyadobacter sp. 50-39 TaxID=1895756 RepID=UPI00095F84F3|nr:hypothetical protein [Dyadobacter sp. 50-39]OJV17416.1 MAG: hypothetical protein BGO21_05065 [Dyadobacter sp. 50-39]
MNPVYRHTFTDIFPNQDSNLSELLKVIPLDELKGLCIHLLALEYSGNTKYDVLDIMISDKNKDLREHLRERINQSEKLKRTQFPEINFTILDSVSLLRLLEQAYALGDYEVRKTNSYELDIFKAVLLMNEMENQKTDLVGSTIPITYTATPKINSLILTWALGQQELSNFHRKYWLTQSMIVQMIKFFILFEFIQDKFPELLSEFLKKFDAETPTHYFARYLGIIHFIFSPTIEDGTININVPVNKDYEANCNFIENFTLTDYDADIIDEEKKDFDVFRKKPLRKIETGKYQIIHPYFAIQKIFNSIYFELRELYVGLNIAVASPSNSRNKFRSSYTFEFSEKYLVYRTLEKVLSNSVDISLSGEFLSKKFNLQGEPDYYARSGNTIFLFESKDNLLSSTIKSSFNFEIISEQLDKILNRKEGLTQIISNIERVLLKKNPFDSCYDINTVQIYPILITHKSDFDVNGMNNHLQGLFKLKLDELKKNNFNVDRVAPLTIVNIDTLILHEFILSEKDMFYNMLRNYHNSVRSASQNLNWETSQNYAESFMFYLNNQGRIIEKSELSYNYLRKKLLNPLGDKLG